MENVYLTQEGPVAGYCKHSDERSWPAERLSASQENCSLVTYSNFCFHVVYISNEMCGLMCYNLYHDMWLTDFPPFRTCCSLVAGLAGYRMGSDFSSGRSLSTPGML